jgi:hypothetical protein
MNILCFGGEATEQKAQARRNGGYSFHRIGWCLVAYIKRDTKTFSVEIAALHRVIYAVSRKENRAYQNGKPCIIP